MHSIFVMLAKEFQKNTVTLDFFNCVEASPVWAENQFFNLAIEGLFNTGSVFLRRDAMYFGDVIMIPHCNPV